MDQGGLNENAEAGEPRLRPSQSSIYKGKVFSDRREATAFVQDYALREGKSVAVSKTKRSAHNWEYVCTSVTQCPFFVRLLLSRSKEIGGCFVSKCSLEHVNCTSTPRLNQRQGMSMSVVQAAVGADAKIPANALIHQVQASNGIKIKTRTAYRIRDAVVDANYGSYLEGIQKLGGLLQQFGDLNGSECAALEQDPFGQFLRLVVVHPFVRRYQQGAQRVLGIDGTHLKHPKYKGVMLVLIGRDGNNRNILFAFAICHSETTDNYRWFFSKCVGAGVEFNGTPVFADRNAGLIAAATERGDVQLRFCLRHILDNLRDRFKGKITDDVEDYIWRAQEASSIEEFEAILVALAITHAEVVLYLKDIDAERWALYPVVESSKMYGWATTSFVEAQNRAALQDRQLPLFQFVEQQLGLMMTTAFKRSNEVRGWEQNERTLTPHGMALYEDEARMIGFYGVMPSTATRAYVYDTRRAVKLKRLVDLSTGFCLCKTRLQMGISCRHILAVLAEWKREHEAFRFFDSCYLVNTAQSSMMLPVTSDGHERGVDIPSGDGIPLSALKPPPVLRKRGRPQTQRFASRGEVKPKKVYKCGQCKGTSHNARRCDHFAGLPTHTDRL